MKMTVEGAQNTGCGGVEVLFEVECDILELASITQIHRHASVSSDSEPSPVAFVPAMCSDSK